MVKKFKKMTPEEILRDRITNLIYEAKWYFGTEDEIDEYYMENEKEVIEEIINLVRYGENNPSKR